MERHNIQNSQQVIYPPHRPHRRHQGAVEDRRRAGDSGRYVRAMQHQGVPCRIISQEKEKR